MNVQELINELLIIEDKTLQVKYMDLSNVLFAETVETVSVTPPKIKGVETPIFVILI